jgi:lactaldehyde reductase
MGVKGVDAMSQDEYRQACIDAVQQLADDVKIPRKLSELGVKEKDIDFLADSAIADACTPGNPRDVTKDEVVALYKSIL